MQWDDYGFLDYQTIFITEYSVSNFPEKFYDKIMLYKRLYCTQVWIQLIHHFEDTEFYQALLTSAEILSLKGQLWGWNTHPCYGVGLTNFTCVLGTIFNKHSGRTCSGASARLLP